jgi:hypothetical protein
MSPSHPSTVPRLLNREDLIVRDAVRRKMFKDLTLANIGSKDPSYFFTHLLRLDRSKLDSKSDILGLLKQYDVVDGILKKKGTNVYSKKTALLDKWLKSTTDAHLKSDIDAINRHHTPITTTEYDKIKELYDLYKQFYLHQKQSLVIEGGATTRRENVLGVGINKAKSFLADARDWYREAQQNYWDMDKGTRRATIIAGIIMIGLIAKTKAGAKLRGGAILGLKVVGAAIGFNLLTKLGSGKYATEHVNAIADDIQNINETFRDRFDIPHGHKGEMAARNMQDLFVMCGNRSFYGIAKSFLDLKGIYDGKIGGKKTKKIFNTKILDPRERSMTIYGVNMDGKKIYQALNDFNNAFPFKNFIAAIDELNRERAKKGLSPIDLSVGTIMAIILTKKSFLKQIAGGKIAVMRYLSRDKLGWTPSNSPGNFWHVQAAPHSWQFKSYSPDALDKYSLDKLCNARVSSRRDLADVIKADHVVPQIYEKGFLATHKKMLGSRKKIETYKDTAGGAGYAIVNEKVSYSVGGKPEDYIRLAITDGFNKGMQKLEGKYGTDNVQFGEAVKVILITTGGKVTSVRILIHTPFKPTSATDDNKGALQYRLMDNGEWPEGRAALRGGTETIKSSKKLNLASFEIILKAFRANKIFHPNNTLDSFVRYFNTLSPTTQTLKKTDTAKIGNMLEFMSDRYAGVLSYEGLTYYLISHGYGSNAKELRMLKNLAK